MADKPLHWADQLAARVIHQKGDKKKYTVAAGITPSGTVHIGNFREIITVDLVRRALEHAGKKTRFIYSWDDFDVFRKVPENMPEKKLLKECLRKPIVDTPDTFGCEHDSFAAHNIAEVEEVLPLLDVNPEFIRQSKQYRQCKYAAGLKQALDNTETIKKILDKYRKEDLPKDWLPVSIFCESCSKDTITKLEYKGDHKLYYECECGHKEEFNFKEKGIAKLKWRIDWPMRWKHEDVDFEPAGKEHSTPGGSRTTAIEIGKEVYNQEPPVYQMYDFIIIKGAGGKMSSSLGNVIKISDTLDIYEPSIVRWLFAGTRPNTEFAISFDLDVLKIYEDFDKCERIYFGEQDVKNEKELANQKRIYELSHVGPIQKKIPFQPSFRHLTNVLLINNLDIEKSISFYEKQLKDKADKEKLRTRAQCAVNWLNKYAPDDFKFTINEKPPKVKLSKNQIAALKDLAKILKQKEWEDKELHEECYIIIKNNDLEIKDFFTAAYKVLISKEKGPKLAAFLIEIKEQAIKLFEQV